MNFASHIKVYIVGGYVRDRLLGRECHDHDFVVVGATPQDMLNLGFEKVGADFPVFLHPVSRDEYALARTERKVGIGYNGFETDYSTDVTLEDDLARRDLTINSMAREVIGWNEEGHAKLSDDIIDPFNGQQDLANRILRHTTEAFAEDPLRVLRVARFRARYGFDIDDKTESLMFSLVKANEIESVTVERIWVEMEKALSEDFCHLFFETLMDVGALSRIFPMFNLNTAALQKVTARNRPVLERVMALFFSNSLFDEMSLTADIVENLTNLKAPSTVIKHVEKFMTLVHQSMEGSNRQLLPQFKLTLLKSVDAFRQQEFETIVTVCDIIGEQPKELIDVLAEAFHATKDISFKDLTSEQQKTLKGKEVGEAIDQLRLKAISIKSGLR